jgi:hypothetical protein
MAHGHYVHGFLLIAALATGTATNGVESVAGAFAIARSSWGILNKLRLSPPQLVLKLETFERGGASFNITFDVEPAGVAATSPRAGDGPLLQLQSISSLDGGCHAVFEGPLLAPVSLQPAGAPVSVAVSCLHDEAGPTRDVQLVLQTSAGSYTYSVVLTTSRNVFGLRSLRGVWDSADGTRRRRRRPPGGSLPMPLKKDNQTANSPSPKLSPSQRECAVKRVQLKRG